MNMVVNHRRPLVVGSNFGFVAPLKLFAVLIFCITCSMVTAGTGDELTTVDDSFQRLGRTKANVYFIKSINDEEVMNAQTATGQASWGHGSQLMPMGTSRPIPAGQSKLHIVGNVQHVTPLNYMLNAGSNYRVEGDIEFKAEENAKYLVTGQLGDTYSAVWIEDINGNIVSPIIEKRGADDSVIEQRESVSENRVLSREQLFLNISGGETSGLVKAKLGEPGNISIYKGNIFNMERGPTVTYEYNQLGKVEFSAQDKEFLYVNRIFPLARANADPAIVTMKLQTEGMTLRAVAQDYYRTGETNTQILDLFAGKVWAERFANDSYTIDALSYFCKILGKSSNPRYRSILQNIEKGGVDKKLQRYAKSSLKMLPNDDAEQFVPGDY